VAQYRVSAKADRDLLNIWMRIAADNEPAADRFHDLLYEKFHALANSRHWSSREPHCAQHTETPGRRIHHLLPA
jgi:plasmid stabilization system protein ParE